MCPLPASLVDGVICFRDCIGAVALSQSCSSPSVVVRVQWSEDAEEACMTEIMQHLHGLVVVLSCRKNPDLLC